MRKNRFEMNQLNENTKSNMKTRTVAGLIVAAIFFPIAFVGGWPFFVLFSLVLLLAIFEVIRSINVKNIAAPVYVLVYVVTIALVYWGCFKNLLAYHDATGLIPSNILAYGFGQGLDGGFNPLYLSPIALCVALVVMFMISIASERLTVQMIAYYFMMMVFMAIGFQSIFYLRYLPMIDEFATTPCYGTELYDYCLSFMLFFYMLIGSVGNDLGAYFFGVLFGKHKMNERVSPKKTWEGFAGGILFSMILSVGVALILDASGHPILKGVLDMEHWYWIVLCSLVMPLVSTLGDLSFSAIKRHFNFKDFGTLIPGHGGVLDRLDSIFFCSIGLAIFIILIRSGWNFLA